jgi:hypothetical protein
MRQYALKLYFTNLDENLNTKHQAAAVFDIWADTEDHAELLAQRMEKVHGADHYKLVDMQAGR